VPKGLFALQIFLHGESFNICVVSGHVYTPKVGLGVQLLGCSSQAGFFMVAVLKH
jgi:hypothetical protein